MRFPIFIFKLTLFAVLVISCFTSSAQNAKYYFDKADTFYIKYTIKGNFDSELPIILKQSAWILILLWLMQEGGLRI